MALPDQGTVKDKDFVYQVAPLIAVVDDQRVHPAVDAHHLEMQVGNAPKALSPVVPSCPRVTRVPAGASQVEEEAKGLVDRL